MEDYLPTDFDWKFYLEVYPDLQEAGIKTESDAKYHYLNHGRFEKRIYKNVVFSSDKTFDWRVYKLYNMDILISDVSNDELKQHFLNHQESERRIYQKIQNITGYSLSHFSDIFLFYHVYAKNDWKKIFMDQYKMIKSSGLLENLSKIFINISGNQDDLQFIKELVEHKGLELKIISNDYEFPTLELIRDISNKQNFKGLYIHTKSSSYSIKDTRKPFLDFWRQIMDYQLIKNWKICYDKIHYFDLVGTLFRKGNTKTEQYWKYFSELSNINSQKFTDHFSGNFFWFDSLYMKNLPQLTKIQKTNRFNAEWYPFSLNPYYLNIFNDTEHWLDKMMDLLNNKKEKSIERCSSLAHKYLDGKKGLEISPSSLSPFNLDTINVDWDPILNIELRNKELKVLGTSSHIDFFSNPSELNFDDNSFDFIVSNHQTENCFNLIKVLNEFKRVIKNGGFLFLISLRPDLVSYKKINGYTQLSANICSLSDLQSRINEENKYIKNCSVCHLDTIIHLLESIGFTILESMPSDDKSGNGWMIMAKK